MKRLLIVLAAFGISLSLAVVGCTQATPAPTPAQAPAAPTKAAEPTKPAVSAPAPTKAAEATTAPTAVPAKKVDYPQKGKPVTVIVPWAAGGATDVGARMVAAQMEKELGTPFQIVNRVGAGSQIGVTELANAKPDGYTIGNTNLPAIPTLYLDPERKATFSGKSFQPIANYLTDPMVLVVKGAGRFKTLKDLVDEAKARPEKVSVANTGMIGPTHLPVVMLEKLAGVKFAHVQIDATPAMTADLLGDHLDAGSGSAANWTGTFKSGEIRYLAIHDPQESPLWPGVKTTEAQGYKVHFASNHGFSAPAGTPREIVAVLSAAIKKATQDEAFNKKMNEMGFQARYMDTSQHEAYWNEMEQMITPYVKQLREDLKKQ